MNARLLTVVAALCVSTAAWAQPGGGGGMGNPVGISIYEGGTLLRRGVTKLAGAAGDFAFTCTAATCSMALGSNVTERGDASIGEPEDFRNSAGGGIDASGTRVRVQQGTAPTTAHCDEAGDAGGVYVDTDGPPGARRYECPGATGWEPQGGRFALLGGTGTDGAFQFDGSCSAGGLGGDCCRGGTISGSSPNKVCALTANSILGRSPTDAGTTLYSCVYEYATFSLSGGTVTCGQAGAYADSGVQPTFGAVLWLRIKASPSLTGGTLDMAGKGVAGGAAGSNAALGARNGGNGGSSAFFPVVAGGTGNAAGTAGTAAATTRLPSTWGTGVYYVGIGGGGGAGSGSNGGNASSPNFYSFLIHGGIGGGGGGCANAGSTGAGTTGGRGGGGLVIETAGTWACNAVTLTAAGSNGAAGSARAGSGGGGGGGIALYYRDFGTETSCTFTVAGGSAGARGDATNCGTGGAGGAGLTVKQRVPY
jgi:hypothetical protein